MVAGFVGPSLGLDLVWSVVAVVLGAVFGTFFMAFHANQGPRMGLPQMIQSRAQFGIRGAVVPFIAVLFVYIGFNVFNVILATQSLQLVLPGGPRIWYPILIVIAVAFAVVGYDLLHFIQRWLTYLLIVVFGVLTVGAAHHPGRRVGDPRRRLRLGTLPDHLRRRRRLPDLLRRLRLRLQPIPAPRRLRPGRHLLDVPGAAASAVWLMALGAFLGSSIDAPDAIGSLQQVGNSVFAAASAPSPSSSRVPALVSIMAINFYGAMLTGASAVDGFRPVQADRPQSGHRDRRRRGDRLRRRTADPG